jgi:hypothetical protein
MKTECHAKNFHSCHLKTFFNKMEKHEQIVRELDDEFKKIDIAYEHNEMRIFGNTEKR